VSENTLMLSLMRSARIAAYGYGGGYGPGMSSDTGLELGRELTFHYALAPHAGSWQQARVFRHGMEFNNPLFCVKTEPHPGPLPKRWEGLTVSPANLVLSAFKPGRDGSTIVRVYEAAGIATAGAVITCQSPLRAAQAANLMEDTGSDLAVAPENQVRLDFAPFEIKTLKLKVQ
jgi:alpha-mannosidase